MVNEKMGPVQPWWRIHMVWLVIGLPAVVVVASFALLFVAIRGGDTPLPQTPASTDAQSPATQGRNHAATPRH